MDLIAAAAVLVASMLNALKASTVEYGQQYKFSPAEIQKLTNGEVVTVTNGVNYMTVAGAIKTGVSLAESDWALSYVSSAMDKFGRPGHSWNKFSDNKVTTTVKYGPYIDTPLATYTVAAKKCDVIKDIGTDYAGTTFTTYTNGNAVEDKVKMTDTATESIGAQGRLTEVYDGTIVYVDTFLANVTKVIATKTDANGHTTDPETTIAVFDNTDTLPATLTYGTEAFKLGDFVLITAAKVKNSDKSKEVYEVASMVAATSKSGRLTTIKTGYTTDTADLQNIAGVDNAAAAVNVTGKYINTNDTINGAMAVVLGKTYSFFYDTYGNVIGAMNVAGNFCVIDELYREPVKGTSIVKGTLVKPDASKLSDVTITMIDNRQDVNNGSHGFGLLNVAQDETKNTDYYNDVYTYTVDSNGNYQLAYANLSSIAGASYVKGEKSIGGEIELKDTTVILLQTKDSPKGTFASYTGYTAPTFSADSVEYVLDANGYASFVYVMGAEINYTDVFVYDTTARNITWVDSNHYKCTLLAKTVDKDGKWVENDITMLVETDRVTGVTTTVNENYPHAGLYEIVFDGAYAARAFAYPLSEIKTLITKDNARIAVQYVGNEYTSRTEFDTAGINFYKYVGTETVGTVSVMDRSDLALGDLLYIQWTDKDNNDRMSNDEIVAVYDMYIDEGITVTPTTVKFTTSAPAYMNKTFPTITLTVGAKDTVVVKMNDKTLEAVTDYTYDAATGKITSPKLVTGPIVITVTPYAKSSDAKLVADNTNPARNCTLSVQEEVTPKTVTVTGQEGKTVTIADLKACLKTNNAGASYKIYDNTTKTEITDGTVSVNYVNMFVLVTAEDGTTAQYDIITSAG